MADEEIPLRSKEGNEDKGDKGNEGEDGERETSFGGDNVRERGSGARPKTKTTSTHANPSFEVEEGGGGLDDSIIEFKRERQDEAERRILEKYSCWDPTKSKFVATIDDKGQVVVSLIKGRKIDSKPYVLFKEDGTLRKKWPKAIVDDLGKTTFEIIDERDVRIDELTKENEELKNTNEGLNCRFGSEFRENEEKVRKLGKKDKGRQSKYFHLRR